MPRNYELDYLKSREQDAFSRKQTAFQHYADARDRCNEAHAAMQIAWEERCSAREEMNREYEEMQRASENYREVWDEYGRIRNEKQYEIDRLRADADYEHQSMIDCFEKASDCYEYGDRSEAPYWSQQGHEHKDRRNELNEEISRLCQEIKDAKANAEWRATKTNSSAFHRAKDAFEQAKSRHESAQAEFKRLKAERDHLKDIFDSLQEEHTRLKEEFQRKLEEVKAANKRERDRTLEQAGVRSSERGDAKIIKKADGTTQIYHGGIGGGDGLGHGHTVLDPFGKKTYARGAFEEHGHQNFTNEETRWDGPHHGVILGNDHDFEVTFSQGMGKKSGQTVIADGHLSEREFHRRQNHNHYGPDTKYGDGSERIEDKGGDRGKYHGPGH